MSSLTDEAVTKGFAAMILGIPLFIGIGILIIPFVIVSCITDVPMDILIKNLAIFALAVFLVYLFSKHQIIENGIVGLTVGSLVYTYFKWHPIACILIGVTVVGLLFFITYRKIGFWIKTILFSLIVTFMVFMCIYSKVGFFPLPDMIWKVSFFIVFFLENIFIRCSVAYDNDIFFDEYVSPKKERYHNLEEEGTESATESFNHNENQTNNFWFAGISNAEELKKRYRELMKIYHPDNQAGDTNAVQQIQQEYEQLLNEKFNNI